MTTKFLSSLLLVGVVGCSPCHSGHYEVSYYETYTSLESQEIGDTTIHYPVNHPARCDYWFRCDWTCKTIDQGRLEAHPKHQTLRLVSDAVDLRCNWDGVNAWPK